MGRVRVHVLPEHRAALPITALVLAAFLGAGLFAIAINSGWLARTVSKTVEPRAQMSWDSKLSVMMAKRAKTARYRLHAMWITGAIMWKRYWSRPKRSSSGSAPPDRRQYPSAHNYWPDVAYNFGLLALLPVLAMLAWTVHMMVKTQCDHW